MHVLFEILSGSEPVLMFQPYYACSIVFLLEVTSQQIKKVINRLVWGQLSFTGQFGAVRLQRQKEREKEKAIGSDRQGGRQT